jgi:hypothetical protein
MRRLTSPCEDASTPTHWHRASSSAGLKSYDPRDAHPGRPSGSDSPLVSRAIEYARENSEPYLFNRVNTPFKE